MKRFRYWQALLVAVLTGVLLTSAATYVIRRGLGGENIWSTLGLILSLLGQVAPGFLVGYLAAARGFLLGAIAGFLVWACGIVVMFASSSSVSLRLEHLMLFVLAIQPIVIGCVAGGAGEFVRKRRAV